jgi:hypothetical protein
MPVRWGFPPPKIDSQSAAWRFRRFTGRHSDQKPDAVPRIHRTRFRLKTGQF